MRRDESLQLLAKHRKDEIVVAAWEAAHEWPLFSPSERNFRSVRTMGEASTFGLGLALARPDLRVFVLEGDGSLLMNLSCLATIAAAAPANYYQFVLMNRVYELTGGHSLPNADQIDFVAIAKGCGLSNAHYFDELDLYDRRLPELLSAPGPALLVLEVQPGKHHISAAHWEQVRSQDEGDIVNLRRVLETTQTAARAGIP